MDEILHKDNNSQNSNNISSFLKNFYAIVIEFGEIVYPLILFYYCFISYGSINLFFISRTYKDPDMINAIGISNLYVNITTGVIINGITGALETLASNAYGAKNYKLMGIYFDRCRYIAISFWLIMAFVHFFFARTILGLLKVEERVIDLALEYIVISVLSLLVNINFFINQKHLVLIEKPKINFYISFFSLIIQIITGYLLVVVFKYGVRGSALSYFFSSLFNAISSTLILKRMDLEEGSLVFFTKEGLKDWKNYLNIAIPGVLICGGEWIGYELQSIFAIYISPVDYSTQIIVVNLELIAFPYTGAINSAISMKSGDKLMTMEPEKLKNYFLMSYLFSFCCSVIVLFLVIFFGNFYFEIMAPNEEIYLNCIRVKLLVCWHIFAENVYYFFLGCLKGYGYLRNTTIATIVMFFVISPILIYILAFRCKFGVKGLWASTSFSMTLGDVLFIYWVFSFDLIKIKELANKRIKADNKNIVDDKKEVKEIFLMENDNSELNINNKDKDNKNEIKGENHIGKKEYNNNNNIEMNYINNN